MQYNFDFDQLAFSYKLPSRRDRPEIKLVEKIDDPVPIEQYHTVAYKHVDFRPNTLPGNCNAVWYTDQGTWLELDVGPESLAGQRNLPNAKILRIERIKKVD